MYQHAVVCPVRFFPYCGLFQPSCDIVWWVWLSFSYWLGTSFIYTIPPCSRGGHPGLTQCCFTWMVLWQHSQLFLGIVWWVWLSISYWPRLGTTLLEQGGHPSRYWDGPVLVNLDGAWQLFLVFAHKGKCQPLQLWSALVLKWDALWHAN